MIGFCGALLLLLNRWLAPCVARRDPSSATTSLCRRPVKVQTQLARLNAWPIHLRSGPSERGYLEGRKIVDADQFPPDRDAGQMQQ